MQTECISPQLGGLDVMVGGLSDTQTLNVKMIRENEAAGTSIVEIVKAPVENGLARFQAQSSLGEKIYFYLESSFENKEKSAFSVIFR